MGVVVNHRQESDEEQYHHVTGQFDELHGRTTNDEPVVNDLDEQTGQDTELRPARTRLTYHNTYHTVTTAQSITEHAKRITSCESARDAVLTSALS